MEIAKFELKDEDYFTINLAKNIAHCLLKHPKITPLQIIGLGKALYDPT